MAYHYFLKNIMYCIPCYQELLAHDFEECKKPIGPHYKVIKGYSSFNRRLNYNKGQLILRIVTRKR